MAYLKPFPPPPPTPPAAEAKETEEAKNAAAPVETDKAEKTEEPKADAKAEVTEESKPETDMNKETPVLPETKEGEAEAATAPQDTTSTAPAEAEQIPVPAVEPVPVVQSTTESVAEPISTVGEPKQADTEPVAVAAAVPLPADSTPVPASTLVEEITPTPVSVPVYFPPNPCVVFLTPSDPIFNSQGSVPGGGFVPSPKTLFCLSRSALQVAVAKYAMSLGGQAINVVGIERPGVLDPVSAIKTHVIAFFHFPGAFVLAFYYRGYSSC